MAGRPAADIPTMRRVYWQLGAAAGCLLAVAILVLFAWMEVALTPPDQCASESCGDIWLLPVFMGPWFLVGAIVLSVTALFTLRRRRRLLRDRVVEGLSGTAIPGQMTAPSHGVPAVAVWTDYARPTLRVLGGLIDLVAVLVVEGLLGQLLRAITDSMTAPVLTVIATGLNVVGLIIALLGPFAYFSYFWSVRGQSVGMMVFGFKVRDLATGGFPTFGQALLRGIIWYIEVLSTFLIVGAIGWLWQFWDPQKQAVHDKAAGTVVTVK